MRVERLMVELLPVVWGYPDRVVRVAVLMHDKEWQVATAFDDGQSVFAGYATRDDAMRAARSLVALINARPEAVPS
jgi:hypothetical protein